MIEYRNISMEEYNATKHLILPCDFIIATTFEWIKIYVSNKEVFEKYVSYVCIIESNYFKSMTFHDVVYDENVDDGIFKSRFMGFKNISDLSKYKLSI